MRSILALLLFSRLAFTAEPEFPLTEDSKPQPNVPKGTMLKDTYIAKDGSVFPGTGREYQIYLPPGFGKTKPAAFMVFQDGVIYQAPVVFDNLIAKKDIPALVGIFIKPGVVPAASDKALPRFNRSYEYDSVTPTYSQFLLDEFLPAIEAKHGLKLSTDPNLAAISGNSSGGICAFMVAWHRPDRFRRVFTGVGTYVGIHGADQLPVLVRKFEPKPLRVFLQSGTGDNNLYCGDWWMANQMMERSLTWAGYDVNHAWGEGGHNAKHASQIFPDVLRWLWRDWQTNIEIKANAKGESKWKGYEVIGEGKWEVAVEREDRQSNFLTNIESDKPGNVYFGPKECQAAVKQKAVEPSKGTELPILNAIGIIGTDSSISEMNLDYNIHFFAVAPDGGFLVAQNSSERRFQVLLLKGNERKILFSGERTSSAEYPELPSKERGPIIRSDGVVLFPGIDCASRATLANLENQAHSPVLQSLSKPHHFLVINEMCFSPDQTLAYLGSRDSANEVNVIHLKSDGGLSAIQPFCLLQQDIGGHHLSVGGLCVDTNGWLYVATSLGIQVCDQAGRVNFIIPTPKQPHDVCFGGKDLSELFIACGDAIYKRPTKAHGIVSGQMAPIKPPMPKL